MISFSREQVILVTGASSGIGGAIALKLNALGATVVANGRNTEKLEDAGRRAAHPEAFHPAPLDLTANMDGLDLWVRSLREKYGKFSGLACASGKTLIAPFMQYDAAAAGELFDLCCHAPLALAKSLLDRRNCREGCAVVFIASAAAIAPNKGQSLYGAAKAALAAAARGMSRELAPRGIRVNCVSPGLVRTPMLEETVALLGADFLRGEEPLYPLGLGRPEDVAALAAFLLSSAARWMTGQNIVLDGGRLA